MKSIPENNFGIFACHDGPFSADDHQRILNGPIAAAEPRLMEELAKPLEHAFPAPYAIRPKTMPQSDADTYWPDGVPPADQLHAVGGWTEKFTDASGAEFQICYTKDQVSAHRVAFRPFFPFMVV